MALEKAKEANDVMSKPWHLDEIEQGDASEDPEEQSYFYNRWLARENRDFYVANYNYDGVLKTWRLKRDALYNETLIKPNASRPNGG